MSLAVYLVEAGLILTVSPWTAWWQHNYFAELWPAMGAFMAGPFARWFVVSAGVLTTLAGMSDLRVALLGRLARPSSAEPPASSTSS